MKDLVTIQVKLETIKSGNTELLMCEARDCLDGLIYKTHTTEPSFKIEFIDRKEWGKKLRQ